MAPITENCNSNKTLYINLTQVIESYKMNRISGSGSPHPEILKSM